MPKNEDWKNELYTNASKIFFSAGGFTKEAVDEFRALSGTPGLIPDPLNEKECVFMVMIAQLAVGLERAESKIAELEKNERTEPPKSHS